MKRFLAMVSLSLLGLVTACQKKPADTNAAASAAPASAAPAAPAAPAGDDLATPEDFEQQALDEINPQNLEQELDKLEKEIVH